ncbi:DUF1627 domain-containing protein [Salmonella enterica]
METVTEALKAMGKASSIELASRLGVDKAQVVNELWALKREGVADKRGMAWSLVGPEQHLPDNPEALPGGAESGKPEPDTEVVALPAPEMAEKSQPGSIDEMMNTIPKFTEKRPDDVILPSLHLANRELRRAKGQVQKWQRVCAALRELNKHRDIVARLRQEAGQRVL